MLAIALAHQHGGASNEAVDSCLEAMREMTAQQLEAMWLCGVDPRDWLAEHRRRHRI